MPTPGPDNSSRVVKGVAWLLAFRLVDRLAGIVSFVILARLLLPEHFGIVTLATGVVALVELMSGLGLDTALVQMRRLERAHYDTAWTIQLGVAALCSLAVVAIAWPASRFLAEPRLLWIVVALGAAVLVEGLQSIKLVDFRREMRFDLEFTFLASRRVITVIVTITAAVLLRNEWALAIGVLSSRVIGTVLSYVLKPYRPKLTLAKRDDFLHKSIWMLASGIVVFARARSSDFVLGKMEGMASVGTFTLASDLASMASNELVLPINRVALADLSGYEAQQDVVARFNMITGLVAVIVAPLTLGLAACAPILIPLLFGPAWSAAIDVLEVMAVAALIAALASNLGVPMISLGHYRFNALIQAIGAVALLPLLLVGTQLMGAIGAAWAVLAGNVVTVATALGFAKRAFGYGPVDFIRRVWRPVAAAVVMAVVVRLGEHALLAVWPSPPSALLLASMIAFGAASYPPLLAVLWLGCGRPEGAEVQAMRLAAAAGRRIRSRVRAARA